MTNRHNSKGYLEDLRVALSFPSLFSYLTSVLKVMVDFEFYWLNCKEQVVNKRKKTDYYVYCRLNS